MLVYHVLYPLLMYGIMRTATRHVGNANWIYAQEIGLSFIWYYYMWHMIGTERIAISVKVFPLTQTYIDILNVFTPEFLNRWYLQWYS